ncbi:MAG TPA: Hsp20/alpha crystallin family protein [Ilumatobacteraceae bacterium]|nr:Hsp20/alpha crystallin family protein [Ilumatobacteraceae bacterium]
MTGLLKREPKHPERVEVFDWFDRMFDDWTRMMPFRRPAFFGRDLTAEEMIRVDEFRENGTLVMRAELPGIDPDKDVELTVSDGMLRIEAERREEEKTEEKNYVRQELRYGSFTRVLPLPEGVSESDVKAHYENGILEIRIPTPKVEPTAVKIPIEKT